MSRFAFTPSDAERCRRRHYAERAEPSRADIYLPPRREAAPPMPHEAAEMPR